MAFKLLILLGLAAFVAAAPRTRHVAGGGPDRVQRTFNDFLFRRDNTGGCSPEEIALLEGYGVDVHASSLACSDVSNDVQKRSCSLVYTASSACCSPGCNWLMEFHCMSPAQMICKK